MFTTITRFSILLCLAIITACSTTKPKAINPEQEFKTTNGFKFKFPMKGDWHRGESSPLAEYVVGQEPKSDGSTTLAIVKHDVFIYTGNKKMTNKDILNVFKEAIVRDAKQGPRLSNVKTQFTEAKYKNADCLFFSQVGLDSTPQGSMTLANDGKVCMHPKKEYVYVWMAIGQRVPLDKSLNDMTSDKQAFFDSLEFID